MISYTFSDKERAYFAPRLATLHKLQAAINGALDMISLAQGLEGDWTIAPDGSGLVTHDVKASAAQEVKASE